MSEKLSKAGDQLRWIALPGAPILAAFAYFTLGPTGLEHEPRAVAAVALWMAMWWMTEAVPLAATSLLPLVLFPVLQVTTMAAASSPYAHPLVGLFFGGFVLGMGVEKWGLHRRLALATVLIVGTQPTRLIAGFMIATAVLSMFISNTATALMMLPIAVSVIGLLERMGLSKANFGPALLLAIAFSSSIGGVATVTGTQPNIITVALLRERGIEISWGQWLPLGLTLFAIMMPLTWFILTRVTLPVKVKEIPGVQELLRTEYKSLGGMSRGEWTIIIVFAMVAAGWIFRGATAKWLEANGFPAFAESLNTLGDAGIAMLGAIVLFAIPVNVEKREFAMDWASAVKMPWDVLLLFGGGLSLAAAMGSSGLDVYIGDKMGGLAGLPTWAIILIVTLGVVFLTELTSNTATTAALVPVLGSAAEGMGIHPVLLMVPAGIVASYAFMLPVATPPNAIIFSSGRVKITQMAWSGLILSTAGAVVITLVVSMFGGTLLQLDLGVDPATGG
ncbi:MAG: DASS family sodium-coupled anion symporter [Planctomycetota bacterium]